MTATCVFVYGTLRTGERNHHWISECPLLARPACVEGFTLYDFGPYPIACPSPEADDRIAGELYHISNPATWKDLDHLEGYPDHYTRGEVRVRDSQGGIRTAFIYFMDKPPAQARRIPQGDWLQR